MSLSLNGAFWPTILPLFHGSRWMALATDPVMVSHRVEGQRRCAAAKSRRLPLVIPAAGWPRTPEVSFVAWRRTHVAGQERSSAADGLSPDPSVVGVRASALSCSGTLARALQELQ